MHRIFRKLILGFVPLSSLFAQNAVHSSTLTLSAGEATTAINPFGQSNGPAFGATYEFRALKYLALDTGVTTMLPKTWNYELLPVFIPPSVIPPNQVLIGLCSNGCVAIFQQDRSPVTLVPFGVKGILPLWSNRLELFAGGGGAYAFHAGGRGRDAMLVQGNLGGRTALDRAHRFWLGTSGHFYSNFGSGRQEWTTWSVDFGIRFGH